MLTLAFIPGYLACHAQSKTLDSGPAVSEENGGSSEAPPHGQLVQGWQTPVGTQAASVSPVVQGESGIRFASLNNDGQVTAVLEVQAPETTLNSSVIDLAICLDTSGSMDGLIDSAKQTLWSIVNDLALVQPTPVLRVALLTFGNDGHSAENGWVHVDLPLTSDLDAISQRLFGLSTNGGTEYVGRVVDAATKDLHWSSDPSALKLLVVAGNESADQDPTIGFREASKQAIAAGIMVNSIYCGDTGDPLALAWREVSLLADGHFSSIDQNGGMIVIETPFDAELSALTASVNETYIPWGQKGQLGRANQVAQDLNNFTLNNEAMAQRAMAKNSALYSCSWDLVDACKSQQVKVEDLDRSFLSEELRALSDTDLQAHIKTQGDKRAEIQSNVTTVAAKRQAWLAEERLKLKVDDSKALDRVMRDAIRAQAASKGLRFKQQTAMPMTLSSGTDHN